MATLETWNGRTSAQTDAESPLDTTLMDGIRHDLDHLRQVLYGNNEASGSYYTPAWGHTHDGTNSKPVTSVADGAITPSKFSAPAVGNYIALQNEYQRSTTSSSYVKLKETIWTGQGGSLRIKFYLASDDNSTAYGRIYRNGVAVGTQRSTWSVSFTDYSEDISGWSTGDLVQIYAYNASGTASVKDIRICVASPHVGGNLVGY